MSEAKHTPGPWLVDAENSGLFEQDQARFWINADGMHVAYVDGPRNAERTANARLIAAAPELLEALKQCRLALEPYDDVKPRDWKTDREKLAFAHQAARASIKKAEGGAA